MAVTIKNDNPTVKLDVLDNGVFFIWNNELFIATEEANYARCERECINLSENNKIQSLEFKTRVRVVTPEKVEIIVNL